MKSVTLDEEKCLCGRQNSFELDEGASQDGIILKRCIRHGELWYHINVTAKPPSIAYEWWFEGSLVKRAMA